MMDNSKNSFQGGGMSSRRDRENNVQGRDRMHKRRGRDGEKRRQGIDRQKISVKHTEEYNLWGGMGEKKPRDISDLW
jgi:hypothetical protein